MFLVEIKIFNFKCFTHKCLKEKVCAGVNLFSGPNGSGKTTLLSAIEILFSEKNKEELPLERNAHLFYENRKNNFSVIQATFDNQDRFFPIPFDKIKIKKIFSSKLVKMVINNFLFSEKRFFDFIASSKIGLETIYLMVRQGSQSSFRFLDPGQRLNFFKKKIGITFYKKSKKKSIFLLEKTEALQKKILFFIFKLFKKVRKKKKYFVKEKKKNFIKKKSFLLRKICNKDEKFFLFNKLFVYQNNLTTEKKIFRLEKIRNFFFFSNLLLFELIKKNITLKNKKRILPVVAKRETCKTMKKIEINIFMNSNRDTEENWKIYFRKEKKKFLKNFFNAKKKKVLKFLNYRRFRYTEKNTCHDCKIIREENINGGRKEGRNFFFLQNSKKENQKKFDKNQFSFLFSKNNPFFIKRKFFFYSTEICVEIEFIKKSIFKEEKFIEKQLGKKIVKGIRQVLYFIKKNKNLKEKVFGLFSDLFSVHKFFKYCVENLVQQFLHFIVVESDITASYIIKSLEEQESIKINFLTISDKFLQRKVYSNIPLSLPLCYCIFYRKKFNFLFMNFFWNIFVTKKSNIANLINNIDGLKLVSLDGDLYEKNTIRSSFSSKNYSFLTKISFLKKERLFLQWIILIKKKLDSILVEIDRFSSIKNRIIILNRIFRDFLKNYEYYRNFNRLESFENHINFEASHFNRKRERKIISENFFNNYSKLSLYNNKNKIFSDMREENIFNFKDIKLIFQNYSNFNKKFSSFSLQLSLLNFGSSRNKNFFSQKKNKIFKYIIPSRKNLFFLENFLQTSEKIYSFRTENSYFCVSEIKKRLQLWIKIVNLIKIGVKKEMDFLSENRTSYSSEEKFFFSSYFLFTSLKNFSYLNKDNEKEIDLRKKIFKLVSEFRQIETDLFVVKQTFNAIEKKKSIYTNNSLKKVSLKFNQLCSRIFEGGNGSIIIHYDNSFRNFSKKSFSRNISGFSVLFKLKKTGMGNFLDQSSAGVATLIYLFLLISLREIIKVKIYIFDEFDSNLDSELVKIFCYLVKQISSLQIQFLISSFKKPTSYIGDKWFSTVFGEKGSNLININKENSLNFIKT